MTNSSSTYHFRARFSFTFLCRRSRTPHNSPHLLEYVPSYTHPLTQSCPYIWMCNQQFWFPVRAHTQPFVFLKKMSQTIVVCEASLIPNSFLIFTPSPSEGSQSTEIKPLSEDHKVSSEGRARINSSSAPLKGRLSLLIYTVRRPP